MFDWFSLLPCRWRHYVPPKRRQTTELHGVKCRTYWCELPYFLSKDCRVRDETSNLRMNLWWCAARWGHRTPQGAVIESRAEANKRIIFCSFRWFTRNFFYPVSRCWHLAYRVYNRHMVHAAFPDVSTVSHFRGLTWNLKIFTSIHRSVDR
jgi:hypothetical protein